MKNNKIKFKKFKKGRLKKFEFKVNKLKFGILGLKAVESGIIKSNQLISAKQAILKKIKKKGKIWVRVFSNLSVTSYLVRCYCMGIYTSMCTFNSDFSQYRQSVYITSNINIDSEVPGPGNYNPKNDLSN